MSNSVIKCGCVIVNYNDAETTIKMVDEIYNYSSIIKIVIVDNCSIDNSFKELKEHFLVPSYQRKIDIISTDFNGGYGKGNNLGIKHLKEKTDCSIALIANPDVSFSEKTLVSCLNAFEKNSKLCVVSPVQKNANGQVINQCAWLLKNPGFLIMSNGFLMRHTFFHEDKFIVDTKKTIQYADCVPGSLLLVKMDLFLEVQGYNERMFLYYEENCIGKRLQSKGYKTCIIPNEFYVHYHSVSISKSIPSLAKQRKIQYDSLIVLLEDEYHFNKGFVFIVKLFLYICFVEEIIIEFVKRKGIIYNFIHEIYYS